MCGMAMGLKSTLLISITRCQLAIVNAVLLKSFKKVIDIDIQNHLFLVGNKFIV